MTSTENECPVCLNPAERGRDKDYGDKKQVRCPRCGPYEISRTALAMLRRRVEQDALAMARLSHAIRLATSEANWLFISSANLDELAQQPLPGVPQQLGHLTRWLASQLSEDRFGRVPLVAPDTIAAIVGAVDGTRVKRLIEYAIKQGVVEQDEGDSIGLSPEGWQMAQPPKQQEERAPAAPLTNAAEIVTAHCNTCGPRRNAYKRASYTVNDNDGEVSWSDTYDVLECCGCNGLSVRREFWFSEWDFVDQDPVTGQPRMNPGIEVSYWPPETKRKKPEWASELDDKALRDVIGEVYDALNSGLIIMASIGTRTLLDRAMFLRVGDPRGGFAGKLDLMVERGHIGRNERDTLQAITDAGSAAAHRGFNPTAEHLAIIVATVENFLHREFVLRTAAGAVRAATPPRRPQEG